LRKVLLNTQYRKSQKVVTKNTGLRGKGKPLRINLANEVLHWCQRRWLLKMKEKHLYLNVSQLHTSMGVTDRLNPFQVLQKR